MTKNNSEPKLSNNEALRKVQIFCWALKEYVRNGIKHY
jgi:hypothetical protein